MSAEPGGQTARFLHIVAVLKRQRNDILLKIKMPFICQQVNVLLTSYGTTNTIHCGFIFNFYYQSKQFFNVLKLCVFLSFLFGVAHTPFACQR